MPRILQIIVALVFMMVFSPFFLIIALILWMQGDVLFKQQRIRQGNRSFTLYKFRTMYSVVGEPNLTDHHGTRRITPFGKFLRRFSLDELPQLWNILQGDMNLVGPRPLPIKYLPLMDERVRNRHQVKPGITGWAQVNGRNTLSWEEKFRMDLWYVENRSLILDLKILLMTLPMIFNKKGIDQDEYRTMEEYSGDGSLKFEDRSRKPEA